MGAVVCLGASGTPNDFEFTASFATQRLRRVRTLNLQALEIFRRHIAGHILTGETGRIELRHARIIVADRNWGIGSSRESAVYALFEFGIRCVIASSFGDIHANNCYKNGLLPVTLADAEVADIRGQLHAKPGATIEVDLESQTVIDPAGNVHRFEIEPVRKKCLLEGLDDIARTHQYAERLAMFEDEYRSERPWLYSA